MQILYCLPAVSHTLSLVNDKVWHLHCVKSVRIWSYSGPYFPAFGLNNSKYGHFSRSVIFITTYHFPAISCQGYIPSIVAGVVSIRSCPPEVFLGKDVLKICSKFTEEHPCRSMISMKCQSNFTEITRRHRYSPVNLLLIFNDFSNY